MIPTTIVWADTAIAIMRKYNWTIADLALNAGLKYHTVHKIVRGFHTEPRWGTAVKLYNLLHAPL